MAGPIKPSEVQSLKNASLPEEVFKVINDLIVEKWDGHQALVVASDAASLIASALSISRDAVYGRKLLDVEDAYRQQGWGVTFNKPDRGEDFASHFIFRKKPGRR